MIPLPNKHTKAQQLFVRLGIHILVVVHEDSACDMRLGRPGVHNQVRKPLAYMEQT